MKTYNDKLRTTLQAYGLRYSRPRGVILGYFGERAVHVSAEELHHELKCRGENLSLSTVYLNLGVLKHVGLVREISGASGEALYDSNVGPHHHLICTTCGAVSDLPEIVIQNTVVADFLKSQAETLSGWQIDEPRLGFRGVCPACQALE